MTYKSISDQYQLGCCGDGVGVVRSETPNDLYLKTSLMMCDRASERCSTLNVLRNTANFFFILTFVIF